jgi:hypothetical protein
MRSIIAAAVGGVVVAVVFVVLCGQQTLAQQPANYTDISQNDFKEIDDAVRKVFEPLKKGDNDGFKKLFLENSAPGIADTPGFGGLNNILTMYKDAFGESKDLKYVRHDSIENVTDYYVFFYADMRRISLVPWELAFYRVDGKWKIVGFRCEAGNPVEFFKFPELQYKSFSK